MVVNLWSHDCQMFDSPSSRTLFFPSLNYAVFINVDMVKVLSDQAGKLFSGYPKTPGFKFHLFQLEGWGILQEGQHSIV